MTPVAALLDAAAKRREENKERYAAFMASRGSQDIGDLSRGESLELFAIVLAAQAADAEVKVLRKLLTRLAP
jgi:hypothetical protein